MENGIDPLVYKWFIVIVVMLGQAGLWVWVGWEAKEKISWWPFKDEY